MSTQHRLHFLRLLNKCHLEVSLLQTFYRLTVERVLDYGITVWYTDSTARDRKALQRVIKIIGCPPALPG